MKSYYKQLVYYKKWSGKFLLLNLRAQCEHLSIQLLWATAQLLVSYVSPIYLLDKFTTLLLVLLKETKILSESKIQDPYGWKASPQTFLKCDWIV